VQSLLQICVEVPLRLLQRRERDGGVSGSRARNGGAEFAADLCW